LQAILQIWGANITVNGTNVTVTGTTITLDGNTTVNGNLTVNGNAAATGTLADSHGSLDRLRGHYNAHIGHAATGSTPSTPDSE